MKRVIILIALLIITFPVVAQVEMALPAPPSLEIARLGRGSANALSWRADGEMLAIGGSAGVWLFDADLQQIRHYETKAVSDVAFSPTSDFLAVSYTDDTTAIWSLDMAGELLSTVQTMDVGAHRLRWHPERDQLVIFSVNWLNQDFAGMDIQLRDVPSSEPHWTTSIPYRILDVVWSMDGSMVVAGDRDGHLVTLEADTGELLQTIDLTNQIAENNLYEIVGVAFHESDLWLIFTGSNSVWTWDFMNEHLAETDINMQYVHYGIWKMVSDPNTIYIFAEDSGGGGAYGDLYVLQENRDPVIVGFRDSIVDYAFRPKTDQLALLTRNGMLRVRDIESDELKEYQLFSSISGLAWSPDGRWLAQSTGINPYDDTYPILVWDAETAGTIPDPDHIMYPYLSGKWMQWLPDSQHLMVYSDNTVPHALCLTYTVEQWNVVNDQIWGFWEYGICGLQHADLSNLNWEFVVDWTPDFSLVAEANGDGIFIAEQSTYNGVLATLRAGGRVWSVRWSPDANYVVSVSDNLEGDGSVVEVWQPLAEERISSFNLTESTEAIIWSPDSSMLAFFSHDEMGETSAWVYDALTGEPINQLRPTFPSDIYSVSWSADSSLVALSSSRLIAGSGETEYRLDVLQIDRTSNEAAYVLSILGIDTHFYSDWHPEHLLLAVTTSHGVGVYSVDPETDRVAMGQKVEPVLLLPEQNIGSLKWSPDGIRLAGIEGGTIRIWDVSMFNQ